MEFLFSLSLGSLIWFSIKLFLAFAIGFIVVFVPLIIVLGLIGALD